MAGNRLEKIGTIFTRASGLLKSGAVKPQDKPLWYDVYEAFPPKYEPRYDRPPAQKEIRPIFYPEDVIRGKFYRKYGSPGVINLSDTSQRASLCQLFVAEYEQLKASDASLSEEKLMEEAALALEGRGIYLDPSRAPAKPDQPTPDGKEESSDQAQKSKISKISFADVFKESQKEGE